MSGKGVVHLEDTVDDAVFLPSASISHDLAEDVLVYIKTNRGYLAGGFDKKRERTPTLFGWGSGDLSLVLPKRHLDNIIEMVQALNWVAPGMTNDDTLLYIVRSEERL